MILGRTLSLDRIEFKSEHFFSYHAMFTKDLNLGFFLFNTIHNRSPFKITFCWNFISNALSTNLQPREFIVILKANSDLKTVELIVFILGGVRHTPNAPWKFNQQKANSAKCSRVLGFLFFILKTSRIDLKKIEGKKKRNEMRYGMVHKSKVTDQGYQGYKRHWMSLTFSTLLVVLNKKKKKLKQWEITWQNSDAKMQGLV